MTEDYKHEKREDHPIAHDHSSMGHEQHSNHEHHHTHDSTSQHHNHTTHHHDTEKAPADASIHGGHNGHGGSEEHAEHSKAHADHSGHEQLFRRKFWVSLILSIPVLIFSEGLATLLGFAPPSFPGSQSIAPVFSVVIFIYGGLPFLQMAIPELRNRQPGMMTLISLAISVAFIYSVATLFLPGQMDFFWELVTLIDIMLLGHWIEMRSVRQASGALDSLAKLMPDTAERLNENGETETVPVSELHTGDRILVRPGASIPAVGEVI
jgi:Cu2+-exporting ATPase